MCIRDRYSWGALELTSDQYELIDEMSYEENVYDTQYDAPSRFDIKVCERRLFVNQKHFFGTDFCKVIDAKGSCTEPDKIILKDMANLSWFEANYNIETESTADLFQSMSENNWIFKGYTYLVDGEISITKKSDYDYLWLEKAIDENKNNPSSQFYSLIIDSVEDAKVENNIISISLNFISEQMLNNDEGKIIKNKDTWTFEKPVNSSTPIWILTQT